MKPGSNRKTPLLLLTLAIVAAGVFLTIRYRSDSPDSNPQPNTLPSVVLGDLTLKNNRLFEPGRTNPFTGWILEHYANAAMKSRSLASNGLLNGLSEGWHTNGQLSVREHFRDGVSHGQRVKWYPDGARLSEASIVEGELHGPFLRWHENGQLAEELRMNRGKPDGQSRSYYPSGSLKAEVLLRDGTPVESRYYQDGEKPAPAGASEQ